MTINITNNNTNLVIGNTTEDPIVFHLCELPEEMILEIFTNLNVSSLTYIAFTNLTLKRLAVEVLEKYKKISKFANTVLSKNEGYELLPKNIVEVMNESCPYLSNKKVFETHVLVMIPKGLSIVELGELAKNYMGDNGVKSGYCMVDTSIKAELGDVKTKNTSWVLMFSNLLADSENRNFNKQLKLIKAPYTIPKALEAASCLFAAYFHSRNYLFGHNFFSYTHCDEVINERKVVVGGMSDRSWKQGVSIMRNVDIDGKVGIAPIRRLT